MKKLKLHLLLSALAFTGLSLFPVAAFADDQPQISGGIIVSPPNQNLVLVPGETYYRTIEVASPSVSADDIKVSAILSRFGVKEQGLNYETDFETESNYNQIVDWITLEETEATIAPGGRTTFNYTITVPADAPAGGQYAAIKIRKETNPNAQSGIAIADQLEISSLIYAIVLGDTNESGEILENKISGFSFDPKITASAIVKNTGNVHSDAHYALQVFPLFSSEEIYTNEENPGYATLIPNQTYLHSKTWDSPVVGIFRVVQTVTFAGQTSTTERFVVICPLWLIFILVAALVLFIVSIVISRRKRHNY